MKTTIDTRCNSYDVDLKDIGNMIMDYCKEVERLEEELGAVKERINELETENAELKEQINREVEK